MWYGVDQWHEQGVGLLMALAWKDALLSFHKLGPMLMSARFEAKTG
jgi:hypothetical protein